MDNPQRPKKVLSEAKIKALEKMKVGREAWLKEKARCKAEGLPPPISKNSKKKVVEKKEIIEKGANTVAKAKKGVKSINLDFITDDRSVDGLKKMSESLKKMGVTRITLVGKLKNYDLEGKYHDLADFMTNRATPELKDFITEQVLGK